MVTNIVAKKIYKALLIFVAIIPSSFAPAAEVRETSVADALANCKIPPSFFKVNDCNWPIHLFCGKLVRHTMVGGPRSPIAWLVRIFNACYGCQDEQQRLANGEPPLACNNYRKPLIRGLMEDIILIVVPTLIYSRRAHRDLMELIRGEAFYESPLSAWQRFLFILEEEFNFGVLTLFSFVQIFANKYPEDCWIQLGRSFAKVPQLSQPRKPLLVMK